MVFAVKIARFGAILIIDCTFPELSASCDPAGIEALNEPADFWRKPATDGSDEYSSCNASRRNS